MLPDAHRLRLPGDFRRTYARGRSISTGVAVVHVLARKGDAGAPVRYGFVVSRKQGGAVARNRIRRRMRQAVRSVPGALDAVGMDVVFVARRDARACSWPELIGGVSDLLARAGVVAAREDRG